MGGTGVRALVVAPEVAGLASPREGAGLRDRRFSLLANGFGTPIVGGGARGAGDSFLLPVALGDLNPRSPMLGGGPGLSL